jgi:hypothetical protein
MMTVAMALETWSYEEDHIVILSLWVKHVSQIGIHWQLLEAYGDGIMNVQHIRE